MADFLDEKRREIAARLKELRPLVEEYRRLEAAAAALDGVVDGNGRSRTATTRRSARGSQPARTGKRGRPKGSGTRSKQALALVRDRPGITVPEIAKEMGIHQNYLYRVMPDLQKEGLVRKEGRGWHPMGGS